MPSNGFWLSEKRPSQINKIVSLVPSQTELLFDLGLQDQIIGITFFCVHPTSWKTKKIKVGGTKTININKVVDLQPDIVVANKEENVKEQIMELANHFPVFVTDISNYKESIQSIKEIAEITETNGIGDLLISEINNQFEKIKNKQQLKIAYLIWREPYMTVGGDTFISSMLNKAGFINCFQNLERYPIVSLDDLKEVDVDYIFLATEPFPFKEKHKKELVTLKPLERIKVVDGEYFSWYGSRMKYAASYFDKRNFIF